MATDQDLDSCLARSDDKSTGIISQQERLTTLDDGMTSGRRCGVASGVTAETSAGLTPPQDCSPEPQDSAAGLSVYRADEVRVFSG